jgi:hypothetical protein
VSQSSGYQGQRGTQTGGGSPWATGLSLFAGVMMAMSGLLDVFYGIMAAAKDNVIVNAPNYVFRFNVTTWGWIHIILGALVALIGFGVLAGKGWARGAGIGIVALAAIGNFLSIPYYPFWSLVLLAIEIFIIWALATAE